MQDVNNRLAHLHELAGRMTFQKLVDDEFEVNRVADRVGQCDLDSPFLHEGNVTDAGQVEILHPRLHGREGLGMRAVFLQIAYPLRMGKIPSFRYHTRMQQ